MQYAVILSYVYLAAWLCAAATVITCRWAKIQPGISAFLCLGALQAFSCVLAGPSASPWWWVNVWAPLEVIAIQAAFYGVLEAVRSKWWLLLGGLAGGLMFPHSAFGFRHFVFAVWDLPATPEWFEAFLKVREWFWIGTVAAVALHSIWLICRPVTITLLPAVYRSRWIFSMYALAMALGGSAKTLTGGDWVLAQTPFRAVVVILLVRWCMLAPIMYSVAQQVADRNPREA